MSLATTIAGGGGGGGGVAGPSPASSTDNALVRWDGTGGATLQNSALTLSDVAGASVTLATTAGNALVVSATAPAAANGASQAGKAAALAASNAVASLDTAGAAAGGSVTITTGNAARLTSGSATGGNLDLTTGTGIGGGEAGNVRFLMGGSTRFVADGAGAGPNFRGNNGNSFALFDTSASSTVPTVVPNRADTNTGLGAADSSDNLSIISGGVEYIRVNGAAASVIVAPTLSNDAATPSLAFGDGDTGFYESSDDVLGIANSGAVQFQFSSDEFRANNSSGAYIRNVAASSTVPTLRPNRADNNTGIGANSSSDEMSLIAGGAEIVRVDANGNQNLKRDRNAKGADVASANDMTLGADGNFFDITGTTQINTIAATNWTNGSIITLQFDSNPTVKHNTAGTGALIFLAGAADFASTAGDMLTLILHETGWREISRAVI